MDILWYSHVFLWHMVIFNGFSLISMVKKNRQRWNPRLHIATALADIDQLRGLGHEIQNLDAERQNPGDFGLFQYGLVWSKGKTMNIYNETMVFVFSGEKLWTSTMKPWFSKEQVYKKHQETHSFWRKFTRIKKPCFYFPSWLGFPVDFPLNQSNGCCQLLNA